MDKTEIPAYIGRAECGCVVAAIVDDGTDSQMVSENVASFIKNGMIIERKTVGFVRENWGHKCGKNERHNNRLQPTTRGGHKTWAIFPMPYPPALFKPVICEEI